MNRKLVTAAVWVILIGCGDDSVSYQSLINDGWSLFQSGQYNEAIAVFAEARDLSPERADAFAGMGWCRLKQDDLTGANADFAGGSPLIGTRVDLLGGWTFVLNAQKNYVESNTQADALLGLAPAWSFPYASGINVTDIRIVKAENFFALGNFSAALAEVKTVNPSFTLGAVTSASDEMALAAEIERLKSIN